MKKSLSLLAFAFCATLSPVYALTIAPYTPAVFAAKQQAGERVSLHFHANWCPTCRAQEKVFKTFQGDASVHGTMLLVDYDNERELKREMRVNSQSTVIVFNGKTQIHRSGGVTDTQQLRAALSSH
jgi:thioredoxin-like negative regulator of GroEL